MSAQSPPVAFHDARLSIPVPAEDAVDRPRVDGLLDAAIGGHPVTVITGSGGCGKTYAVSMWARCVSDAGQDVAWASLDRADGDPYRFWLTVAGALQRTTLFEPLAGLMVPSSPDPFFVDTLSAALGALPSRLILVLDDVHELAGSRALESLESLQRSIHRQHRLVLISRHDPPLHLHRLRLAGGLGEVRGAELAFTSDEAEDLLRAEDLDPTPAELAQLMATTEGWAAGLRLATMAAKPAGDTAAVVADLRSRDSLVSAYLLEEVVAGLGTDRAAFLMRTSVVDRVCAPLARALTGEESSGALLESLVQDNVLVTALEDTGWFRYHPMLIEMLRARLRSVTPDLEAQLHLQAQRWFEESGEWLESLRHAGLSGDEALTAQVALRSAVVLAFTPERVRLAELLNQLAPGLPQSGDPERQLCLALEAHCVGDNETTRYWLEQAEPTLGELPEPRRQLATIAHRLLVAAQGRLQGDPHTIIDAAGTARRMASELPRSASRALPILQSIAVAMLGVGELWRGRPVQAEQLMKASVRGVAERSFGVHAQVYHGGLRALSEISRGRIADGGARAISVLEIARVSGWSQSYESGPAWLALATAKLHAADLAEVHRCLAQAHQTRIAERDPFIGASMSLVAARLALTAGDLSRAHQSIAAVDQWLAQRPRLTLLVVMRAALMAEVHLAANEPRLAADVLADVEAHLVRHCDPVSFELDPVPITRGHVLLATGRPQEAADVVASLRDADGVLAGEAWLVTCLAHDRLRADASAIESLGRALAYAAAENALQTFLRRSDRLPLLLHRHLEMIGTHRAFVQSILERITGLPEALDPTASCAVELTERERSVLAYLPTLSTNLEIADQLSISVNTVKQHLKTINRKLGVGSRREAVRVARRLGMLPDGS